MKQIRRCSKIVTTSLMIIPLTLIVPAEEYSVLNYHSHYPRSSPLTWNTTKGSFTSSMAIVNSQNCREPALCHSPHRGDINGRHMHRNQFWLFLLSAEGFPGISRIKWGT
ncbi:hypothetical protein BO86DRAFT_205118 [Aspergillus japonicus CBS 114.51]|uniref:Uncharacterized protein n=1 Tax=Aspergillus japonicus CBS 114.51 TaxID=1448312 RepID=A0A8T8WQ80_ASPJA|nr:hypothetical protein BO86DRAFT_205118 [Aspergillus japonicus CBS 114.51]RAH77823.1 hypothetical protein BO86DRAFT_205118 [Aspergillus japonicus CBS 114.51]